MKIAIVNEKGGSGKTTLALNIAAGITNAVLYDLDPQASATAWKALSTVQWTIDNKQDGKDLIAEIKPLKNVVIDCPPGLQNMATAAALAVCDIALIPITPSGADIMAAGRMIGLIKHTQRERKGLPIAAIVPNRVDMRTGSGRSILDDLAPFELPVLPMIRSRMAFADSFAAHQWIGDYAKNSPAHKEIMELIKCLRNLTIKT